MIDFLETLGNNGVVLNSDESKFQFAQKEVEFAGFHITDNGIQPLKKFFKAICDFPMPTRITDIRSWFGLVHQVAHYSKVIDIMAPFKPLLSHSAKFLWTDELNEAFQKSEIEIVDAIIQGVQTFDINRRTCLWPDWSKTGIGFFLSQKHCDCVSMSPGCCKSGWKITLAGSRFLKPAETRHAPIEGEALAIAWSLEQTKYFTQRCDNLLVVTEHKPLVRLFGDRTLDEISNRRIFRLKQRTLPWRFSAEHMPGKENYFADATSRHPADNPNDDVMDVMLAETLASLRLVEDDTNDAEIHVDANSEIDRVRAVTWDLVRQETSNDPHMMKLITIIESVFPEEKRDMTPQLERYWDLKDHLYVVEGVVLLRNKVAIPLSLRDQVTSSYTVGCGIRVVIPPTLRPEITQSLHAAHQGVSAMNERAKAAVYWPGITNDIKMATSNCSSCNKTAPSQPKMPPVEPWIPTSPFEAIACDYFHFKGRYYFVVADRLSGWTEQQQIKVGTNDAEQQDCVKL